MVPLRLEWQLCTPVAGMRLPLHVDALVAYAVTEEAIRSGATGDIRELGKDLPLATEEGEGKVCWKASALMPEKILGSEMRLWTKKTNEENYARRAGLQQLEMRMKLPLKPYEGVIDTQRGLMKNHFQFIPVRHTPRLIGYCIGDPDRLLELLAPESGYITNIGARGRSGFGKIVSFHMEEDVGAETMWRKRVLPWNGDGLVSIAAAYTNPYWAVENRTTSYIDPALLG